MLTVKRIYRYQIQGYVKKRLENMMLKAYPFNLASASE